MFKKNISHRNYSDRSVRDFRRGKNSEIVYILAGAPLAGTPLNGPRTMAFGPSGDLFLALRDGNAVYRINMRALTLHHIAGTGEKGYSSGGAPAKQAALSGPKGISVGPRGGVYIADTESHTIRRIDLSSGTIEHTPSQ